MRRATGFTQGPLNPPVIFARRKVLRYGSIDVPSSVLISERLSEPASTAARATGNTSVTLGESLVIKANTVALRRAEISSKVSLGSTAKSQPCLTFGQEMLISS